MIRGRRQKTTVAETSRDLLGATQGCQRRSLKLENARRNVTRGRGAGGNIRGDFCAETLHRDFMKRAIGVGALWVAAMALTGCGPKEDPAAVAAVAAAEAAQVAAERTEHFGAAAADPGIVWRPSGLGIRTITEGTGASPKLLDHVRVIYVGRLKDGTVFDDSRVKGKPADFPVNHLMGGFAAALPSMKVGGKSVFYIPPSLGYGSRKAGDIPANSGLIFEVELLAINPELPAKAK